MSSSGVKDTQQSSISFLKVKIWKNPIVLSSWLTGQYPACINTCAILAQCRGYILVTRIANPRNAEPEFKVTELCIDLQVPRINTSNTISRSAEGVLSIVAVWTLTKCYDFFATYPRMIPCWCRPAMAFERSFTLHISIVTIMNSLTVNFSLVLNKFQTLKPYRKDIYLVLYSSGLLVFSTPCFFVPDYCQNV